MGGVAVWFAGQSAAEEGVGLGLEVVVPGS